jgi:putative MFS transporter
MTIHSHASGLVNALDAPGHVGSRSVGIELAPNDAGMISARLDRLPATRTIWNMVILLSLGFFFELYDLLYTGYIAPGLIRSGLLTASTHGLFGSTGISALPASRVLSRCYF